jgi:hypothetical protein
MHRGRMALRPRPAEQRHQPVSAALIVPNGVAPLIVPNGVAPLIGASTIAVAVQLGHGTSGRP